MAVLLSINPTNLTPVNGRAVSPISLGGGRQIAASGKSARLLAFPNGRSILGLDSVWDNAIWYSNAEVPIGATGAWVLAVALPASLKAPEVVGHSGWGSLFLNASPLSTSVSGSTSAGAVGFGGPGWGYSSPALMDASWHVFVGTWDAAVGTAFYRDGVLVASHADVYAYVNRILQFRLSTLKTRLDGANQSLDPVWLGLFEMHDSAIADPATYSTDLLATFADMPIPVVPYPFDVSWTAPQDGDSPITGYQVRVLRTVSGTPVVLEYSLASTIRTFHVDLPANTVNTAVQVLAINALGTSVPAEITV